jgi:hypothetical protein
MKGINLIVIVFAFLNYSIVKSITNPTSNWILDIKNENNTDELIELRPGVLTKIVLIVHHEENIDILDRSFDRTSFTISSKDNNNIMFYPKEEFNIVPSLGLEYIAYVGLKCDHTINSDDYTLEFVVKKKRDLNGKTISYGSLIINPAQIKINNIITYIDIEPIETSLTERGYSFFKIKNEIYNMEKITVNAEGNNNKKFTIEDIYIKAFKDRTKFGKTENDNHGILFDYKFGSNYGYIYLNGETNTTFNLVIKNNGNQRRCFDINPKSAIVNININEKKMLTLNESVKEAVLYSIENLTPKRDKTNNIQFKMYIPVAPVIINCELLGEGNNEKADYIQYRDYIVNAGENIIKFNNLNSNKEYNGECKFLSVNYRQTQFKITIGKENKRDKNYIPLYPSKSSYSTFQCLEFLFTSQNKNNLGEKIKKFSNLAEKLCNKTMIEGENIISRIMGKYICEKQEIESDDKYYKNKSIICIGSSPNYNPENIDEDDVDKSKTYFSEHVDKFIQLVNTAEKINNILSKDDEEMAGLELLDFKRYYDLNPPDINKIKLEVNKDGGMSKKVTLNFKITSNNKQPIECFYEKNMKNNDKKKSLDLYKDKGDHESFILSKNDEITFETKLKDKKNKNMYPLYMNCYNLPGAKNRYEQTGIFIAYTYLFSDIQDQSVVEKSKGKIKCNKKKSKMNPNCLKGQYNNLNEMLKTKMPEIDENEEVEKFMELSDSAQIAMLDDIFDNFEEEMSKINNVTQIIQKLVNKEQFLSNRDCSIYINGTSRNSLYEINNMEYKICRENKKSKQKKIIDFIKNNFNCNYLSLLISKNGISSDVEENIKYINLLVDEITNNADSFEEGDSEVLLSVITCLQENYEASWNQVKDYLEEKGTLNITISAIKKDISNLLINSISNLVKVLHFEEIDNYIPENEKNITRKGLMAYKKGKQVHNNIKHFMKNFNEFGDSLYNLSDSFIININVNDDFKESGKKNSLQKQDEEAIIYEDKGITLLLHPKSMMNYYNAYAMQIINYESPLISIKEKNNVLNTFISITLYNNKGEEIKVDKIPEDIRPTLLYDKAYHKHMNGCYFYNEEIEDLAENGVLINNNYIYNGRTYLKCTAEHLTCFTAGNFYVRTTSDKDNYTSNYQDKKGIMTIIILGNIFIVIFILIMIIIIVKKIRKKRNIEDKKRNNIVEIELVQQYL